ncbi:hemin uptake protein HemP [Acidovorax sp. 107]|uniref:hemin uptake protein HemP n=1 Tax=Acidovorax sp. 107 TaxID=2135638 RepID=UPI000D4CE847|nr:hemin uptake protein HemP [Acidovorax sp. 107]PUA96453.1 hemin uptake protein HemP [Acidovorax sp. 107]
MQASLTSAPLRRIAPADIAGASVSGEAPSPGAHSATAALDSSVLLQGHKTVAISHNGSVYRLQATKLGKLILTK